MLVKRNMIHHSGLDGYNVKGFIQIHVKSKFMLNTPKRDPV